jgi:hypothetical protein
LLVLIQKRREKERFQKGKEKQKIGKEEKRK